MKTTYEVAHVMTRLPSYVIDVGDKYELDLSQGEEAVTMEIQETTLDRFTENLRTSDELRKVYEDELEDLDPDSEEFLDLANELWSETDFSYYTPQIRIEVSDTDWEWMTADEACEWYKSNVA